MKSMSALQRSALRQLFATRPTNLNLNANLRHTLQQRTRQAPLQPSATLKHARSIHTQRARTNTSFTQPFRRRPGNGSNNGRRFNSTNSSPNPDSTSPPTANLSLSQRLKKLSKEYGWSALGVYLMLTALDFPFCFLAVRMLGTDRIGHWEHVALEYIKGLIKWPLPQAVQDQVEVAGDLVEATVVGDNDAGAGKRILEERSDEYAVEDHGYRSAEEANSGANASIWTQLALAYAIHKSFIFVRVPLTAAITPKVVKTLRSWGWNIGKVPGRKGVSAGQSGTGAGTGVNTKGSKVKPDD